VLVAQVTYFILSNIVATMRVVALLLLVAAASASQANPIRKVVNMLQGMQKKVEAEGEKEQELFDKYMCYCKNSGGDLAKSIGDAGTKMPQLEADIKEGESKKVQLDEDLKQHQADRSAAKAAMAAATALRSKEAAAFAKESSEDGANLAATGKAMTAIEKGMGSAFLQTNTASIVLRIAEKRNEQDLVAFLRALRPKAMLQRAEKSWASSRPCMMKCPQTLQRRMPQRPQPSRLTMSLQPQRPRKSTRSPRPLKRK